MKNIEENPFVAPYDYYDGYRESIEKLKNQPELIEFDKLCYEVFAHSEAGKKLMEQIIDKYVLPSLINNNNPKYETACVWAEGFKDAFRLLRSSMLSHAQRIKAETNQ